ncbi:MAG TPA: aldolase [Rhodospirillaceae bacterium]|nr:aldolase [Rhodospirillaceae bacterium]HAA91462.1 aldolase [Rhodospirillaceae bacterium]HAT34644.1 aldolase [Rhodospirillaceae bacterium]
MTLIPNTTKEKLEAGGIAFCFGLRVGRTVNAGMIANTCGFDWLFIDMEHGTFDVDLASQIASASLNTGVTPIVRIPGHQHFHIARVLDGGAQGVIAPHVDTVEQAEAIVRAAKYPPIGKRSMSNNLPQFGMARMPGGDLAEQLNDNTLVIVMLETPEAIENADAIAAVEGVDVLMIGTNDLCAEMGIPGQFDHERTNDAYKTMIDACHKHGKYPAMGGVYDHALMEKYIKMGVRFMLGGADLGFIMGEATSRAKFLRELVK